MAGESSAQTEGRLNPAVAPVEEDTKYLRTLGAAKEYTQPESTNKGLMYALQGVGSGIGDLAKGILQSRELAADEQLRTGIDSLKRERIDQLDSMKTALGGMKGGQAGSMPRDLAKLPDQLQRFRDLRDNNHISNSDYYGRLRQFLKDIRDKYQDPIMRDYIDDTGKKIIGYDPANRQIEQQVQDLNAMLGDKDKVKNNIITHLTSIEMLQAIGGKAGVFAEQYKAGQRTTEEAGNFIQAATGMMFEEKKLEALKKLSGPSQVQGFANYVQATLLGHDELWNTVSDFAEVKKADNMIAAFNNGVTPDPQQARMIGLAGKNWLEALKVDMYNKAVRIGMVATQGDKVVNDLIESAVKPYEAKFNMISDGNFKLAQAFSVGIQDRKAAIESQWINSPVGALETRMAHFRQADPMGYDAWYAKNVTGNATWDAAVRGTMMEGASQLFEGKPVVDVVKDTLKKFNNGQVNSQLIQNNIKVFTSTEDDRTRNTLFGAFFDMANQGLLNEYKTSWQSPNGTVYRPREAAWAMLTQADVVKTIKEHMAPGQQEAYIDRVNHWMGTLFQGEINEVKQGLTPSDIVWSSQDHRFVITEESKRGGGMPAEQRGYVNRLNNAVDRYMQVMDTMKPGQNHDLELARLMQTWGYDPKQGYENPLGVLWHSIRQSLTTPPKGTSSPPESK